MRPGTEVQVRFGKWGDRPHWAPRENLRYLGADVHGRWIGTAEGTVFTRPGAQFATHGTQVMLLPAGQRWFAATFYEPVHGYKWRCYVDICTPPELAAGGARIPEFRAVDLDLDVVQGFDDAVGVEDEDEFAEHQREFDYPEDVVVAAERECAAVVADLRSGAPWTLEDLVRQWRELTQELGRGSA